MCILPQLRTERGGGEPYALRHAGCFPPQTGRPHECPPPSCSGRTREGFTDSPAKESYFHVPPGQHLADAPHFGQVAFDVQNLLFCRNRVQLRVPVSVWRQRLKTSHRTVRAAPRSNACGGQSPPPWLPATACPRPDPAVGLRPSSSEQGWEARLPGFQCKASAAAPLFPAL